MKSLSMRIRETINLPMNDQVKHAIIGSSTTHVEKPQATVCTGGQQDWDVGRRMECNRFYFAFRWRSLVGVSQSLDGE
jgi:hypothetical protein